MPTYSYACTACDHRFDTVQSFSEDSLTTCPECGGRLRKVFSPVGVVFKGGGFYRTDSRTGASSSVSSAKGDGASAKGDGAASTGSEAKPAAASSGSSTSSSSSPSSSSSTAGGSAA